MKYENKNKKCKVCNIGHLQYNGSSRDVDLKKYDYWVCYYCGAGFTDYLKELEKQDE